MKFKLVIFIFIIYSSSLAQSISVETGLGFIENIVTGKASQEYSADIKLGLRGTAPIDNNLDIFFAPYYFHGFGIDSGLWFNFPVSLEDEIDFDSYAGIGLSYLDNRIGMNLVLAISYEVSKNNQITLTYTHRPLFTPVLSQAFDIAIGYKIILQ